MKGAMENNPEHFNGIGLIKGFGIILYPVNTYIYIPINFFILLWNIESDNICVVVMVKKPTVYIKQVFIRAKNIGKAGQRFPFPF